MKTGMRKIRFGFNQLAKYALIQNGPKNERDWDVKNTGRFQERIF